MRNWKHIYKKLLQQDMFLPISCIFFYYDYLWETQHQSNSLHVITCFMSPPHSLLCAVFYKFTWYATENTPHLMGTPIKIYLLSNIDNLLTNHVAMEKQAVDGFKLELENCNIRGGHTNVNMMNFSRQNRIGW